MELKNFLKDFANGNRNRINLHYQLLVWSVYIYSFTYLYDNTGVLYFKALSLIALRKFIIVFRNMTLSWITK